MPVKIKSTSGSVTLDAQNVSGDQTLTVPSLSGGKTLLTTDGDGSSLTNLPAASADSYFASSGLSAKDLGAGLHIKTSDSGGTANAAADELVLEGGSDMGIQFLSSTTGNARLLFGDSGANNIGQIKYAHNDNSMYFYTNSGENLRITSDGRGLSQFTAKMWINFNGTGTVAIRDSHNVSSISDNGTGDYTVTYSNNLANANYSIMSSQGRQPGGGGGHNRMHDVTIDRYSTSNHRLLFINSDDDSSRDIDSIFSTVFGD